MAFVQNLKGIKITPSEALKKSKDLFREDVSKWPSGYAFGGWIYNASCKIGFSKQPTEINLSIVLETRDNDSLPLMFDIKDEILEQSLGGHGAKNFEEEEETGHFYTIEFHGVFFKRMYLYSYEFSIEANQKTLNVVFKDYSFVLNKIYVGLFKRQGPGLNIKPQDLLLFGQNVIRNRAKGLSGTTSFRGVTKMEASALCPNCYLSGEGFEIKNTYAANLPSFFSISKGFVDRDCNLASFVGLHGGHQNNLRSIVFEHPINITDKLCYYSKECAHPRRTNNLGWEPKYLPSPREYWEDLSRKANDTKLTKRKDHHTFTADGGYLLIGTEDFAEKKCGSLPNISYNFTELLNSLKLRGINFDASILGGSLDKNPTFRSNYIGTLREVLEQWCSIMSLDFYMDNVGKNAQGNTIKFLDLGVGADIKNARSILDPSTEIGKEFGGESSATSVIVSYKETSSLDNTYLQRCITANIRPYIKKERSKEVKRYVPILPLHPIDFNIPNLDAVAYNTVLGESFMSPKLANVFPWEDILHNENLLGNSLIPNTHDCKKRVRTLTNRELWDVDIAIALSRYDKNLRDLYVGQRIIDTSVSAHCQYIYGVPELDEEGNPIVDDDGQGGKIPRTKLSYSPQGEGVPVIKDAIPKTLKNVGDGKTFLNYAANCAALGFISLGEVHDPLVKTTLIQDLFAPPEIPDISLDSKDYRFYVGYHDEEMYQEIFAWEQRCAEGMYKYGCIVGGTLPTPGGSFIPNEYYGVRDKMFGYLDDGSSIPKLKNTFEPDAKRYSIFTLEKFEAPFNSLLIQSGNWLPTGLYFSSLDNPWGTSTEEFQLQFSRVFTDNACTKFNNSLSITEELQSQLEPGTAAVLDYKTQSWDLGMFAPKFFDDQEKIIANLQVMLQDIHDNEGAFVDEVTIPRWDINLAFKRNCKKISIMALTNVKTHPNIYFDVTQLNVPAVNYQARRQAALWSISEFTRRQKDSIVDICDKDILFDFCEEAMKVENTKLQAFYGPGIDISSCAVNPTGIYKEGFNRSLIGGFPVPGQTNKFIPQVFTPGLPNSRQLNITLIRNPIASLGIKPHDDYGYYYLHDLEENLKPLSRKVFNKNIVYPVNNFSMFSTDTYTPVSWGSNSYQLYSGIWTANFSIEDRSPELIEIYGTPPFGENLTAGVKIINNTVDPDLLNMADPEARTFVTKIADVNGDSVRSVIDFHNLIANGSQGIQGLDDLNVISPTKNIDIKLAGSVLEFPKFSKYIHPRHGLISYNISLSDDGLSTDLTFATRPPEAPKMEAILNKIGPRLI